MNNQRYRTAIALLAAASLALAVTPDSVQRSVRGRIVTCVAPAQSAAAHVRCGFQDLANSFSALLGNADPAETLRIHEENQRLRELLVIERSRAGQFRKQMEGLADFNEFAAEHLREKLGIIPARVIGRDATGRPGMMVIDRGTADGLREGVGVVWGHSAVGVVKLAQSRSALVQLLTNPDCHVPAYIQRTGESTMVSGTLSGNLRMQHVFRRPVLEGDWVLTSGDLGIFPRDIVIGRVIGEPRVPPGELFWDITVQPQDLQSLQTVIVLVRQEREL